MLTLTLGDVIMSIKKLAIIVTLCAVPLLAQKYTVTITCHVPNGFTAKTAKFSINAPDTSNLKRWIWDHKKKMDKVCEDEAGDGYWFEGIYDIDD